MIGHYVNNLSPAAEDRVLGEKLARAPLYELPDGCRCLVGVAGDFRIATLSVGDHEMWVRAKRPSSLCYSSRHNTQIGFYFDLLVERFGAPRINTAIRNRILSNRARRVLRAEMAYVG